MLTKVVCPRPHFGRLGAVRSCALERTALIQHTMNALDVAVQVVLGGESRDTVTAFHVASERLLVAQLVFTDDRSAGYNVHMSEGLLVL